MSYPHDPDARRAGEPAPENGDEETSRAEDPGAAPSDRPVYQPYDPSQRPSDEQSWSSSEDTAWPRRAEPASAPPPVPEEKHGLNPLVRLGVPQPWRGIVDWVVTIVGAILIVLAIKAWIVNPYRIPSSSMEPTLHCGRGGAGCEAHFSDRVLACRFCYWTHGPRRGDIVVFNVPSAAETACGSGGVFVKRVVGLPGEVWQEKQGYVYINGKRLSEPYIKRDRRDFQSYPPRTIPKDNYFMMGDNRISSCDSRRWGTVPRGNIIGKVFAIYWPPQRIRVL